METKPAQDGAAPTASHAGAAKTSGLQKRRQKNLQKFRRHKAAKREEASNSLGAKPSAAPAQVEEKKGRKTVPKVANAAKKSPEVADADSSSDRPKSPPPFKTECAQVQSPTMSPLASADALNKRRVGIIKKLSKKNRPANFSPRGPASPISPNSPTSPKGQDSSCSASATEQGPLLSMADWTDNKCKAGECKAKSNISLKMKPSMYKDDEAMDSHCDPANENAQSKAQQKLTSKPSEEALKPKTNNNRLKRRTLHHKKKMGKDIEKNKQEKAAKELAPGPTKAQAESDIETAAGSEETSDEGKDGIKLEPNETKTTEDAPVLTPEHNEVPTENSTPEGDSPPAPPESQGFAPAEMTSSDDSPSVAFESQASPPVVTTSSEDNPSVESDSQELQAETTGNADEHSVASDSQEPPASTTRKDEDPSLTTEYQESLPAATTSDNDNPSVLIQQETIQSTSPSQKEAPNDLAVNKDIPAEVTHPGKEEGSHGAESAKATEKAPEVVAENVESVANRATVKLGAKKKATCKEAELPTAGPEPKEQAAPEEVEESEPQGFQATKEAPTQCDKLVAESDELSEVVADEDSIKSKQDATEAPDSMKQGDQSLNAASGSQDESQDVSNIELGNADSKETARTEEKKGEGETVVKDAFGLEVDVGGRDKVNAGINESKDTLLIDIMETSNSFDLRSIHEFPPDHIKEADAALPPQDPSWDTSKVFFTEFQQPASTVSKSKSNTINLFDPNDHACWTNNDTISFAGFETSNNFFAGGSNSEEKKESDHLSLEFGIDFGKHHALPEPLGSPSSMVSPRRQLSRAQVNGDKNSFGFDVTNLAKDSTDELDNDDPTNVTDGDVDLEDDDENLLGEKEDTAEASDIDAWQNEANTPTKEERLQNYTANLDDCDNSSTTSSKAEEEDDSSHSSAEPPSVEYMFQAEEDNEDEDEKSASMEKEEIPSQIVDDAPQLVLSADAASAANEVAVEPSSSEDVSAPHDAAVPNQEPVAQQVDPMTYISASASEDNSKPAPFVQGAGNANGYISNSSSSDSAPSCTDDEDSNIQDHTLKQVEEEHNNAEDASMGNNISAEDEKDDDKEEDSSSLEPFDLEESPSLVGISLVPSFGQSGRTPSSVKAREGIPPRGSLGPSMVPPPPPPPPSKKRRKKKCKSTSSRKGKKPFPLLSPPPEEKLKAWQASKNRALMHLGVVKESHMEGDHQEFPNPSLDRPKVEDIVCGVFPDGGLLSPVESPGRIKLACGHFGDEGSWPAASGTRTNSDINCGAVAGDGTSRILGGADPNICGLSGALATMAGLNASPKPTQRHGGPTPSPVDAARSIALENAMRRANKGSSARFDFPSSSIRKEMETKSLFENELVTSNSMGSSRSMAEDEAVPPQEHRSSHDTKIVEPQTVAELPRNEHQRPVVFLQELTSPSLSMSPSNEGRGFPNTSTQSSGMSPLIHDSKMAEKAALASYAAAVTFEEQYASSLLKDANCQSVDSQGSEDREDPNEDPDNPMSSLFCAPELEANIKKMAREDGKMHSFFLAAENLSKQDIDFAEIMEGKSGILKGLMNVVPTSPPRDRPDETQGLQRGAFTPFAMYARKDEQSVSHTLSIPTTSTSKDSIDKAVSESASATESDRELVKVHNWLRARLVEVETEPPKQTASDEAFRDEIRRLLGNDEHLNRLCIHLAEKMNAKIQLENEERTQRNGQLSPRKLMKPFQLSMRPSGQKSSSVVAANFVSFIHRVAKTSGVPSPFGEDNPFLLDLVGTSISNSGTPRSNCATPPPTPPSIEISDGATMQKIVFSRCTADGIVKFCIEVCGGLGAYKDDLPLVPSVRTKTSGDSSFDLIEATRAANPSPTKKSRNPIFSQESVAAGDRKFIVPAGQPSPFDKSVQQSPEILTTILGILGDPVAVCRLNMMNRACRDYIGKNEQLLMRDAVRAGGLSMNLRPSFWLWVTLEKCGKNANSGRAADARKRLSGLEEKGRTGKWHNVIQRDVARSFGNMPPHKTGARLHTHSIVHALVTWGKNRIMKRGVKGDGDPPPYSCQPYGDPSDGASQAPTDTVSDWGGVSPVASFTGSCGGPADGEERRSRDSHSDEADLLVLSGNALSEEMKADLQGKLGFILHALAAKHEDVGYCQGMDYVVAHLLRLLQDTVCWRAANSTLPASIHPALKDPSCQSELDKTFVVEDAVFQVMDCLFTTYNLQHMYWPELRCLKTCCKVFERLIQLKLPVLADHFEHHELNVGLFALGWFQTLFLYLPSMPSATVCHMWDIWLVERSFKIFFRVGTAILFLSQPTLLNHELEGMQIYLNTFPDATLLKPDILIACALQIKVTNKMLMDIEEDVCGTGE